MEENVDIFRIKIGFTNQYLIRTPKASILVDTSFPNRGGEILERIRSFGFEPEIRAIILTHCHVDHWGSTAELVKKTGAEVLMHKEDWKVLEESRDSSYEPVGGYARLLSALAPKGKNMKPQGWRPDIQVKKNYSLKKYGLRGKIIHTPGHTPGSMSLFLDGGIVICGDTVMGRPPFWKIPAMPIVAWHRESLAKSIRKIANSKPKMILSGHGGPFTDIEKLSNKL